MKNKILFTITWINAISLIIMACAVDSETWIPTIIMAVNLAWIFPFVLVNRGYFDGTGKRI
jgi:hypothetical protein